MIQVLDCTLRDGGYCNDCNFGFENERKIIKSLIEANLDIIECGFFLHNIEYIKGKSRFSSVEQISEVIPTDRDGKLFVALADYGKFDPDVLPFYNETLLDGFRVAFHKKNWINGIEACKKVKEKGYKVFVQPMVSLSYTDEEFLDLIYRTNELEPYAFYIVDSFGTMKRKDLIRLFYLVEHNLKRTIKIGFHSHNNMQLAYSNAQELVDLHSDRDLVIDCSVYGMGRGAGNLNTELFVQYLNEYANGKYKMKPLLTIIDEILNGFYQKNYWGYSLPNYLSAAHNAHPNYAGYLDDKKTLTVEDMNEIFSMMNDEKKVSFDKEYIESLYLQYMERGKVNEDHLWSFKSMILGKTILLIAPGKSSFEERKKVQKFAQKKHVVVISVNSEYHYAKTDFIFLSNLRRFRELDPSLYEKCVVTSNISTDGIYLQIKYRNLLANEEIVKDNAGLMAIKLLIELGAKEIYLAGYDGYAHDDIENYADRDMAFFMKNDVLDAMNQGMTQILKQYSQKISISFLTREKYLKL